MNEKRRPNLQDLSFYYDGLLDMEKRKEVEEWLGKSEKEKELLTLFASFDAAMQDDPPDDRIDSLLDGNLTEIHKRLIQDDHQRRRESVSFWDWLLLPRHILAGVAGVLILFGIFSAVGPMNQSNAPQPVIANAPSSSAPSAEFNNGDADKPKESVVNAAQKQVILAAADLAKRAFSSSVDYAKEQGKPLGESLKNLPQTANLSVALQSVASPQKSSANPETGDKQETLSPNEQLARSGAKQLAIGLGASLLSLISVI